MNKNRLYITALVLMNVCATTMVKAQDVKQSTLPVDSTQVKAVSRVKGEALESYTDFNLSNTLQGQLSGLVVRSKTNGLGNNSSDLFVRGLSRNDDNKALIIVDGMERSMDDLIPEEVASVSVLKDGPAKILYGARAANGVIVVTTKRGKQGPRQVWAKAEVGVTQMTKTPSYLNSYDYATLYNEARLNDGLTPYYSASDLEGYKNSIGRNDVRYPDVSYYDDFLDEQSFFQKISFGVNGGTEKTTYSFVGNYLNADGYEAVGDKPTLMRLNVRGNVNIKVNDIISVSGDAVARLERREFGVLDCGQVMSRVNGTRPNAYPLTIGAEDLGLPASSDNVPYFGSSLTDASNLYADMAYAGFSEERYIKTENNLGLYLDLGVLTPGLKAKGIVSFDNYNYLRQQQNNTYATYALYDRLASNPTFVKRRKTSLQEDQSIESEMTTRSIGLKSSVDYSRMIADKHMVSGSLLFNYYHKENKGASQDLDNDDVSLTLDYNYNGTYGVLATLSSMGSNRFPGADERFLSYAAGVNWVVSNESFMKDVSWLDYLNVKVSFGHLGYDRSTSFLLTQTAWKQGENIKLGEQNKSNAHTTNFVRVGNDDLDWEYSDELNIGFTGRMLNNRLGVEFNYFAENRKNIIGLLDATYPSMLGSFVYADNMGSIENKGCDFHIDWKDKIGKVEYRLGLNTTISKNKVKDWEEVNQPVDALNYVGRSTTAMVGYKALGLYGKDVPMANTDQRLGHYQVGDIAYADLNKDGHVDQLDQQEVGNSFPTTTYGISLNLKYKQWELFVHGAGEMDVDTWANNSYYWNRGDDKYSTLAAERYHPTNNPTGTMPRLTTTSGENNYRNSTFWLEDASFFRLKNVELSYTFIEPISWVSKMRVFARGTNLFVLSNVDDLDPELINSGISNYPVSRNLSAGVSVTF